MKKKKCIRELALLLVFAILLTFILALVPAQAADSGQGEKPGVVAEISDEDDDHVEISKKDKPYLALGKDLTGEQKKIVLSLMGIKEKNLDQYELVTISNQEEHKYLDAYLDSATIGTKALSSVVIAKREEGSGIHISTKNISYCTVGMYKNALATAGLKDADVIVAGPFPISGTAALIGAMKAYADLEDSKLDKDSLDAAMNEIVVTGELNNELADNQETEEFVAYVKRQIVEKNLTDPEEIGQVIEDSAEKFGIQLTEAQKKKVTKLMQKIGSLDLDVDSLVTQAGSVYDQVSQLVEDQGGGILAFLKKLLKMLTDSVKGLLG